MTRGERNNNPGNIRLSSIGWQGKVHGDDASFETFDTAYNGIRAIAKILLHYQVNDGLNTIDQIINKWAPSVENNSSAYVQTVCSDCSVGQDDKINLNDPVVMYQIVRAIIHHENGVVIYSIDTIQAAVDSALGIN